MTTELHHTHHGDPANTPLALKSNEGLGPLVEQLAALACQQHYYCEDSWYTCPAHPEGTANEFKPRGICDCGADEHNAKVEALRMRIVGALQGPNVGAKRAPDKI